MPCIGGGLVTLFLHAMAGASGFWFLFVALKGSSGRIVGGDADYAVGYAIIFVVDQTEGIGFITFSFGDGF